MNTHSQIANHEFFQYIKDYFTGTTCTQRWYPPQAHIEALGRFLIAHHRTGWHIYSNNHVEQYYEDFCRNGMVTIQPYASIDGKTHTLILP